MLILCTEMNREHNYFLLIKINYSCVSRLDRLFVLIETGSSPLTRKAASQQLGEVVKYHPHELQHLLNRVFQLLCSSSWDTRIAASQAVEAVCFNTPEWIPPESIII